MPDNFLSTEQIEAKREAQKIDYNKYGRYAEVFENVDKSNSSNKYSESAGNSNVLPDNANQSNNTDNKAVINNNDIRYSLADGKGGKYSINEDIQKQFEKDVDDVINLRYNRSSPLILGVTPAILQEIGLNALPIAITKIMYILLLLTMHKPKKMDDTKRNKLSRIRCNRSKRNI